MGRHKEKNRMRMFTVPKGYHITNMEMTNYEEVVGGIADVKSVKIFYRMNEEQE